VVLKIKELTVKEEEDEKPAAIDYAQLAAALTSTNIFVRVTDINTAQNNRSRTIAAGVL